MAEFYIATRAQRASEIFASDPDLLTRFNEFNRSSTMDMLVPGKPYLTSCGPNDTFIYGHMSAMPLAAQQRIAQTYSHYEEYTLPIAQTVDEHIKPVLDRIEHHGLPAAAATIALAGEQSSALQKALIKYQVALEDLHQASQAKRAVSGARARGAHNPIIAAKEAAVRAAHADLIKRFQAQLERYAALNKASRTKTTLANVDRSINVAKDGRTMHGNSAGSQRTAKTLQVNNSQQVTALKNYASYSRILGTGAIFVDIGFRANRVRGVRADGGDGTREFVVQSAGLSASIGTGLLVGKVAAGIGIKLALGPVGWVVLIGLGIYAGYNASKATDDFAQEYFGAKYDQITRMRR